MHSVDLEFMTSPFTLQRKEVPFELELIGEICNETMLSIHDWNVV